jgi:hypothetical protein
MASAAKLSKRHDKSDALRAQLNQTTRALEAQVATAEALRRRVNAGGCAAIEQQAVLHACSQRCSAAEAEVSRSTAALFLAFDPSCRQSQSFSFTAFISCTLNFSTNHAIFSDLQGCLPVICVVKCFKGHCCYWSGITEL